jgi:succinate dehydrogenase/fumarate reductase cytochrome b subunit
MKQIIKMKSFNKRAFISTALLVSGLSLPFTGFMNHGLQFDKLSLERHFWMSAHDVAGILFVLFLILHISYNWRALLSYLKKAKERYLSKESFIAIAFVIIVVGLISSHVFHIDK